MKIGFISDTHGNLEKTRKALDLLQGATKIYHLGDVLAHGPRNPITEGYRPKELAEYLKTRDDIVYIRGNCDADVDEMVTGKDLSQFERWIEIDGIKIYATHGYKETEDERIQRAKSHGAKVIITGHTHTKVLEEKEGILLLNPGSPSLSKDGSESIAFYENGVFYLMDLREGHIIKKYVMKNK